MAERANYHLEKLLEKANKEKKMLCHMAYHYLAWNKICKTRIRSLKAKLRRTLRSKKEKDKLNILAKASVAQHSTLCRSLIQYFKKFGTRFDNFEILKEKISFSAWCVEPPGAHFC